ncbi:MAG: molybdopterin-dependent oxidoreductase, partial [Magnetovibrio sp.]|nr:molybdopterin-dependent oxidoreductase [Magnetovibrio sp.]
MLFGRKKKNPIKIVDKKIVEWKTSVCGYCSTGCSIEVGMNAQGTPVSSRGAAGADVNQGKLCIKGIFEHELFDSAGRGTRPLMRSDRHQDYQAVGWDTALDHMGDEIKRIQAQHGRDAFAIVSTGQILTEEFYTLGKLARGAIGTNNYDGNTTLCMASAVSGYKRSFGSDGPPGCYDDFSHTDCLMAFGSNLPEQHPVIYWRLKEQLEKRKFPLIVVDPRVTMFAQFADMHLPIKPGTDLVLLNAMAHVILDEGLQDDDYLFKNTTRPNDFEKVLEDYDPVTAAKICGIDEDTIRTVARLYGKADAAMSIWTMGINQSTHGSDGVVGINNLNLITGNVGKPGGGSLSITGQCNAMGTREWSSCSGLPGYRALENPDHRKEIADFWGIDESFFPQKRGLTQTDIFPAIETGQIKGLWLVGTNPMTSMPNTARIRKTLEKLDFLVVQDAYRDVETTQYAHMFLPAALWSEKTGCLTNTERRVNLVSKVTNPPGESKPDHTIFSELATRFENGKKIKFPDNTSDIFDEMRELSKGLLLDISGMSHDLIRDNYGIQWPFKEGDEKGAQRLYTDGKFQHADGKAKLINLPFIDNNEKPDEDYPFWLNTGRVVEHFHTRTRTGKIGNLNKFSPTPYMEMNPDVAREMGV